MSNRLRELDIRQLMAFRALMEERSVTRAAERMRITQPALSKILHRMREVFADPLFTRGAGGLVATPAAEGLYGAISETLDALEALVARTCFDPAEAAGSIYISAPDAIAIAFMPDLFQRFTRSSPHLRLVVDNVSEDHLELLTAGTRDFSIFLGGDLGPHFQSFPLGSEPNVCWMRREHPLARRANLKMQDLGVYPIASLSAANFDFESADVLRIINIYDRFGMQERTTLSSAQLLTALAVVSRTDALLIGPSLLSRLDPLRSQLLSKPVEELTSIELHYFLIQHRRTLSSPLHKWAREQILASWRSGEEDASVAAETRLPH